MSAIAVDEPKLAPGNKIPGTRISVYAVYYWVVNNYDKTWIVEHLRIATDEYDLALAYINAHRDEVERVHQQIDERNARGNSPEVERRLSPPRFRFRQQLAWIAASRRFATAADGINSNGEFGDQEWLKRQIAEFRAWVVEHETQHPVAEQ